MAMYRPQAFVVDDVAVLHDFIREHSPRSQSWRTAKFNLLTHRSCCMRRAVVGVQFHLARINPMVGATTGATLQFSFLGGDASRFADWYASEAMVPTWNYLAVEASGVVRQVGPDELRQLLIDLSVEQESRLLTKQPWRIGRVPQVRVEALLNAIDGLRSRSCGWKANSSFPRTRMRLIGRVQLRDLRGAAMREVLRWPTRCGERSKQARLVIQTSYVAKQEKGNDK